MYQQHQWVGLQAMGKTGGTSVPQLEFQCSIDKGIKQSATPGVFISHKKNHFQIALSLRRPPGKMYVSLLDGRVAEAKCLHFGLHAIKCEDNSEVRIHQSNIDRSKRPITTFPFTEKPNAQGVIQLTIGRLHFSQTTSNNMRKKGLPHPNQRYFALVSTLLAEVDGKMYPVVKYKSDKIIVRASNPGQFESKSAVADWSQGSTPTSVFHSGPIGINTKQPDEAVTVHGNAWLSGAVLRPSDRRVKTAITACDTSAQLEKVQALNLYSYNFTDAWASTTNQKLGRIAVGVIAQEARQIVPEAVKETPTTHHLVDGSKVEKLLVVDHDRLFDEGIGALKELANVHDSLTARLAAAREAVLELQAERHARASASAAAEFAKGRNAAKMDWAFWTVATAAAVGVSFRIALAQR
jgi:hypothetical protein